MTILDYDENTYTQEQIDIFTHRDKSAILVNTIEISHSKLSRTYFLCQDKENNEFEVEDGDGNIRMQLFEAANFQVGQMTQSQDLDTSIDLQLDIVNSEIKKELDNIFSGLNTESIAIITRTYNKIKKGSPINKAKPFEIYTLAVNGGRLGASARTHEFILNTFPSKTYKTTTYKGLLYVK